MAKRKHKYNAGDLVKLGGIWAKYDKGIVLADDTAWYVIDGHYDVSGCIVGEDDIVEVVKKGAVDPEVITYLRPQEREVRRGQNV